MNDDRTPETTPVADERQHLEGLPGPAREAVTGQEWGKLSSNEQAVTPILTCLGCGRTKASPDGDFTDFLPAQHCGDCPPWRCDGCGEMDSAAKHCSCWIDLTTMAPADVKALFAEDGTFNVGTDGQLSIGAPPCSCHERDGDGKGPDHD